MAPTHDCVFFFFFFLKISSGEGEGEHRASAEVPPFFLKKKGAHHQFCVFFLRLRNDNIHTHAPAHTHTHTHALYIRAERMMETCGLCVGTFRSCRACPECTLSVCRSCSKRVVLEFGAGCPGCGVAWHPRDVALRTGAAFVRTHYREARSRQLASEHSARLGASARAATLEKRRRRLREKIDAQNNQIYECNRGLRQLDQTEADDEGRTLLIEQWRRAFVARRDLSVALSSLERHPDRVTDDGDLLRFKRCGHRACDGSFVDAHDRCVRCSERTCDRCGEAVLGAGETHVCDEATALNVCFMNATCKKCPGCGAASFREEGCTVMWCTQCFVFWCWTDGRMHETRSGREPHNPDRADYLKAQRALQEAEPSPSDASAPAAASGIGIPDLLLVYEAAMRKGGYFPVVPVAPLTDEDVAELVMHRSGELCGPVDGRIVHQIMRFVEATFWTERAAARDFEVLPTVELARHRLFEGIRVRHILGDYGDGAAFGCALERCERHLTSRADVGRALRSAFACSAELLQRLVNDEAFDAQTALFEIEALVDRLNASLRDTHKLFGLSCPHLCKDTLQWRFRTRLPRL